MTNQFQSSKFQTLILSGIFVVAIFFRVYSISTVPPSPSLDEVSIGYNAYSIMTTGADEYGYKYPLLLRAYDDWRPAFYVYLVIPFIKLFGLTVTAVRIPSVLLSLASLVVGYKILKLLTKNYDRSTFYVLLSTLLFTISPWHVYLSRLGHEANLGSMMILLGVWLFLLFSIEQKKFALLCSAAVFALSLNSYQSQKIIAPLTVLLLGFVYRKKLFINIKVTIFSCIVGIIIAFPIVYVSLTPEARIRFEKTNVMKYHQSVLDAWDRYTVAREKGDTVGKIIHNPKLAGIGVVNKQYVLHFNPYWLFYFDTKPEDHKIPGLGLLFLWEAPLILYGIFTLIKQQKYYPMNYIVLGMLLISPIPGALTTQAPHAMRSFTAVPWVQFVGAIGGMELFVLLKKMDCRFLMLLKVSLGFIVVFSICYLFRQYFFEFPKIHSSSFQYGLNTMLADSSTRFDSYDSVYISNDGNLYQSYMFYLFHTVYNPTDYQIHGGTYSGGYAEWHTIRNIHFEPTDITRQNTEKRELFIGNPKDFPSDFDPLKVYNSLDGIPAIVVVEQ